MSKKIEITIPRNIHEPLKDPERVAAGKKAARTRRKHEKQAATGEIATAAADMSEVEPEGTLTVTVNGHTVATAQEAADAYRDLKRT